MLAGLCHVVGRLHPNPDIRCSAEGLGEADRHIGGHACVAVNQARKSRPAYSKHLRPFRDGERKGIETIEPDGQPRVWRIFHRHGVLLSQLVVVDQLDVVSGTIVKTENNSPIGSHGDGPKPLAMALQGVEMKTGQSHIFDRIGFVELDQNRPNFAGQIGSDSAAIVLFKKPFQALMLKSDDHGSV
jgi:hypothetical protein